MTFVGNLGLVQAFFCAFLKNSRGENSSFFRNSRPKTQGIFQNSRYRRFPTKFSKKLKVSEVFMPIFQTWIFWRILPISSETRYQRYLMAMYSPNLKRHVCKKNLTNFEKTQRVFEKTQQISEKLKDFLKNSKKKLKTQGKNSSYRRFPPRVIPGKTPKKKACTIYTSQKY